MAEQASVWIIELRDNSGEWVRSSVHVETEEEANRRVRLFNSTAIIGREYRAWEYRRLEEEMKVSYDFEREMGIEERLEAQEICNCQVCGGAKGGVRGNEQIVNGVVMCDYCHSERMR